MLRVAQAFEANGEMLNTMVKRPIPSAIRCILENRRKAAIRKTWQDSLAVPRVKSLSAHEGLAIPVSPRCTPRDNDERMGL